MLDMLTTSSNLIAIANMPSRTRILYNKLPQRERCFTQMCILVQGFSIKVSMPEIMTVLWFSSVPFSCKDSLQKCPHRKNNVFKMCILVQGFSIKAFMSEIMAFTHVSIFWLSYKDSLQKVLMSDMLKIS